MMKRAIPIFVSLTLLVSAATTHCVFVKAAKKFLSARVPLRSGWETAKNFL